ncbi:MAG: MraY family glycosyltransferase, partial [Candidatus Omnitrophica bacterium]|nr:MraY family glycosyltransferase [Candidatus Omnitrophota bacterium]
MRYFLFFVIPFILSLIFTPVIRAIAIKNNLIAYPRADRWHKKPTAILGGIAIYLASIISLFLFGNLNKQVVGLATGGTFLFIVGLTDDKFHFPPYIKLFTQIIAGSIAIFSGVTFGLSNNAIIVIPVTLLWIVGITNAFNLLDNIDGLAAGIAIISSLTLFFSSQFFSNNYLGAYG